MIGQRCTIGSNVVLTHAYVFDDTVIGADTVVDQSIVGSGVTVGEGSKLQKGCLIGDGVILGKGAQLGPFERVSRRRELLEEEADEEENEEEWETIEKCESLHIKFKDRRLSYIKSTDQSRSNAVLGEGSNAVVWPQGPWVDDDELDEVERHNNQRLMRVGDTASDLFSSSLEDADSSDTESDGETSNSSFPALSRTSSRSSMSNMTGAPHISNLSALSDAAAENEFQAEVAQSLERAFAEGHTIENAAVELKTLRMASNVELRRVREAVVAAIVDRIPILQGDPAAQRREIAKIIGRWGGLIDQIGGVDAVETCEVLQVSCVRVA